MMRDYPGHLGVKKAHSKETHSRQEAMLHFSLDETSGGRVIDQFMDVCPGKMTPRQHAARTA
jgi:hypothetical protein